MELFKDTLPVTNSSIRFLHAIPNAPTVDIYANGAILSKSLSFSKISSYTTITPGSYEIQIYKTGTYDTPLYSQTIDISPSSYYTISVVTLQKAIYLFKLKDDNIPYNKISSFLRFINLSSTSPLVTLALPNDNILFNDAEYLETTGYYQLSSGIYNFKFAYGNSLSNAKFIKNLTLDNGNFYTIYIIGIYNDKPPLGYLFVEDAK